jgi:hypothetical protein
LSGGGATPAAWEASAPSTEARGRSMSGATCASSSGRDAVADVAAAGGACAPLMPGASSVSVGMESTVVFEACWRRFQQRHGAVRGGGLLDCSGPPSVRRT